MTTHWSLVLDAGMQTGSLASGEALETLCGDYWPPIYACVRRGGRSREEAEDLTQEFFASLLRYDSFSRVDPGKGRFRSFLLASLKHFLSNQWHRERAKKRGGGRPVISLDAVPGLEREFLAGENGETPDGGLLVSGGDDNLVSVWDAARGERIVVLRGHKAEVKGLAFSPDGRTIASTGRDLALRMWHVPTWRDLGVLRRGEFYSWLAFSADGSVLLGSDQQRKVHRLRASD